MHSIFDRHKSAIQRVVPKRPHKPTSQSLGQRTLGIDYEKNRADSNKLWAKHNRMYHTFEWRRSTFYRGLHCLCIEL